MKRGQVVPMDDDDDDRSSDEDYVADSSSDSDGSGDRKAVDLGDADSTDTNPSEKEFDLDDDQFEDDDTDTENQRAQEDSKSPDKDQVARQNLFERFFMNGETIKSKSIGQQSSYYSAIQTLVMAAPSVVQKTRNAQDTKTAVKRLKRVFERHVPYVPEVDINTREGRAIVRNSIYEVKNLLALSEECISLNDPSLYLIGWLSQSVSLKIVKQAADFLEQTPLEYIGSKLESTTKQNFCAKWAELINRVFAFNCVENEIFFVYQKHTEPPPLLRAHEARIVEWEKMAEKVVQFYSELSEPTKNLILLHILYPGASAYFTEQEPAERIVGAFDHCEHTQAPAFLLSQDPWIINNGNGPFDPPPHAAADVSALTGNHFLPAASRLLGNFTKVTLKDICPKTENLAVVHAQVQAAAHATLRAAWFDIATALFYVYDDMYNIGPHRRVSVPTQFHVSDARAFVNVLREFGTKAASQLLPGGQPLSAKSQEAMIRTYIGGLPVAPVRMFLPEHLNHWNPVLGKYTAASPAAYAMLTNQSEVLQSREFIGLCQAKETKEVYNLNEKTLLLLLAAPLIPARLTQRLLPKKKFGPIYQVIWSHVIAPFAAYISMWESFVLAVRCKVVQKHADAPVLSEPVLFFQGMEIETTELRKKSIIFEIREEFCELISEGRDYAANAELAMAHWKFRILELKGVAMALFAVGKSAHTPNSADWVVETFIADTWQLWMYKAGHQIEIDARRAYWDFQNMQWLTIVLDPKQTQSDDVDEDPPVSLTVRHLLAMWSASATLRRNRMFDNEKILLKATWLQYDPITEFFDLEDFLDSGFPLLLPKSKTKAADDRGWATTDALEWGESGTTSLPKAHAQFFCTNIVKYATFFTDLQEKKTYRALLQIGVVQAEQKKLRQGLTRFNALVTHIKKNLESPIDEFAWNQCIGGCIADTIDPEYWPTLFEPNQIPLDKRPLEPAKLKAAKQKIVETWKQETLQQQDLILECLDQEAGVSVVHLLGLAACGVLPKSQPSDNSALELAIHELLTTHLQSIGKLSEVWEDLSSGPNERQKQEYIDETLPDKPTGAPEKTGDQAGDCWNKFSLQ